MKTTTAILSTAFIFSLAIFSIASAENNDSLNLNTKINVEEKSQSIDTNIREENDAKEYATSSKDRNDTSTSTEQKENVEKSTIEAHRNNMNSFMKTLFGVNDREDGFGRQVREIAHRQNESGTTTEKAMLEIGNRGATRKFLFGDDYKNLGAIRSEIATTTNNILQLKNLLDRTINTQDRAILVAQIQNLETQQAMMNTYLTMHEDSFSMFGWFMKMFSK